MCPRRCGVNRIAGDIGICGAGGQMRVSRAALHFWEEPPISGTVGSGTIFFAGCNLGCVYCQNRAISRGGAGRAVDVDEVADMMLDLQSQNAMNINLVTPTHYGCLVRESIRRARGRGLGIPVVWNTGGYENPAEMRCNQSLVDVYLTDFKYFDDALAKAYSGVSDYRSVALEALDAMVDTAGGYRSDSFDGAERMTGGVIVRHLLLPGSLEDSKRVVELLHARYGNAIRLSLMNQYTPVLLSAAKDGDDQACRVLTKHPNLANEADPESYEHLLDFADTLGAENYFWQQGPTAKESFIPDFE